MNIENTSRKKAVEVIGIICAVCFMLSLATYYRAEMWHIRSVLNANALSLILFIMDIAGFIVISICVIMRKPLGVLVGLTLTLLNPLYSPLFIDTQHEVEISSIAILIIISLTIVIPRLRRISAYVKYVGIVPVVLFVLCASNDIFDAKMLLRIKEQLGDTISINDKIEASVGCFSAAIIPLSFILLTLWLFFVCSSIAPKKAVEKAQNNDVVSVNSLELLTSYKELLDQGAITQEEFDAKKKELLKF